MTTRQEHHDYVPSFLIVDFNWVISWLQWVYTVTEFRLPAVGLLWTCPALPTASTWTWVWTLPVTKPAWALPEQSQQLSKTISTGRLAREWGYTYMTLRTFDCVYTEQLTATEHRVKIWLITVPSAHCYSLPGAAWSCPAARRGPALVPSGMTLLQDGIWLCGRSFSLPCFVFCSWRQDTCYCLCTHVW